MTEAMRRLRQRRKLGLHASCALLILAPMALMEQAAAQSSAAMASARLFQTPVVQANNATTVTAPSAGQLSAAIASATARRTSVNDTINLVVQAQAAARAAVQALSPPNGLVAGGLQAAVSAPTTAANDPTGLATWQGADLPTQTANGNQITVNVKQNDARALLSWSSFNIGSNTILNFDQSLNGTAQPSWIVLNRVTNSTAPSQIFGALRAQGTVLVLNSNGILFSPTAQVNVHGLIATSLEIGNPTNVAISPLTGARLDRSKSLAARNQSFLQDGLFPLGTRADGSTEYAFAAITVNPANPNARAISAPTLEGAVNIAAGARIETTEGGFVIVLAPRITNAGRLTSPGGQVSLQSGRQVRLTASTGAADSANPNVRGLLVSSDSGSNSNSALVNNFVDNLSTGLIEAPRGYISLGAATQQDQPGMPRNIAGVTVTGAVINDGIVSSTTSVSRNGAIALSGTDIRLAPSSVVTIQPDSSNETIPQAPDSVVAFKRSLITVGDLNTRIEIGSNAQIYAPGATLNIGSTPGVNTEADTLTALGADAIPLGSSRIFIDSGAVLDVGGVKDVVLPASRNQITISPVTRNELRDSGDYRNSFLVGQTVTVDARVSGVRADGVAYVGSPLVDASGAAQQIGVTAAELLTRGGNVTLGVQSFTERSDRSIVPDVIVKPGALIDISGGSVRYQAGVVNTTKLLTSSGQVVDIGSADPSQSFVSIVTGFTSTQPRVGISTTFANPILQNNTPELEYTEGRDAGSLSIKASAIAFDGNINAQAYAGVRQLAAAQIGTARSSLYGDQRTLQTTPTQLPAGGYVNIQAIGTAASQEVGGANIEITPAAVGLLSTQTLAYGQSIGVTNNGTNAGPNFDLSTPTPRPVASTLPAARRDSITLSDSLINAAGLGQLSLQTSGSVTLESGTNVNLTSGAVLNIVAGRSVTLNGRVTSHGGLISVQTFDSNTAFNSFDDGSVFSSTDNKPLFLASEVNLPHLYDITVNGTLDVSGRYVNDLLVSNGALEGSSYLSGGSIRLSVAPRVFARLGGLNGTSTVDLSGSIFVNNGALLDVSGGAYVNSLGVVTTSARGGNLSLTNLTNYFQLQTFAPDTPDTVNTPGIHSSITGDAVPDHINATVQLAPGTVHAAGFAGGGTFSLTTPALSFGNGPSDTNATILSPDFLSQTGFANYNLSVWRTAIFANVLAGVSGGFDALLATQTLTIGSGQSLSLTQSRFNPILSSSDLSALQLLPTGSNLYTTLTPAVPVNDFDQLPVSLTFGGLVELDVVAGGRISGSSGAQLTVPKLLNEGTIRLVGGALTQNETLPDVYGQSGNLRSIGVQSLDQVFGPATNGQYDPNAANALGLAPLNGSVYTNAQVANEGSIAGSNPALGPIYLLGRLGQDDGLRFAAGSVTDLSGASIRNPRTLPRGRGDDTPIIDGRLVDGGTISTTNQQLQTGILFNAPTFGLNPFSTSAGAITTVGASRPGRQLVATPGASVNLTGVADTYDRLQADGSYLATPVASNGGNLNAANGGTLGGSNISAAGGSADALGGTLTFLDPVFTTRDPATPQANLLATSNITTAGFSTVIALHSATSQGDATLNLSRAFFLTSRPQLGGTPNAADYGVSLGSGGDFRINAPIISLGSTLQSVSSGTAAGILAGHSLTLSGEGIDISGAVLLDRSIANAQFTSTGDIRLLGVQPPTSLGLDTANTLNSLTGQLLTSGNLTLTAAQVYATTGTGTGSRIVGTNRQTVAPFIIGSTGTNATITLARSTTVTPDTPYSAGTSLTIQAANIIQGGVLRAPLGTLTLGSSTPLNVANGTLPATATLNVNANSITSVSANGLNIPYGETTDLLEYFFTPTNDARLTAPPAGQLSFAGANVALNANATIDLHGGGDVFAYEFVSGTGGSHDVLSRLNTDQFSSRNGLQYADGRQVYAIVPSLKDAVLAPFDPLSSADYSSLYGPSAVGQRVYLDASPGLAAGFYTLLPARYALLPGGLRLVENTASPTPAVGAPASTQRDGSVIVSGSFVSGGSNIRETRLRSFTLQSQTVIRTNSNIQQTSGNTTFTNLATRNQTPIPQLPIDSGRLIINPSTGLILGASVLATPATGGRGAQVDIAGDIFQIVSTLPSTPASDGTINITAASLTNLNAASLLIGGIRTDNADGTTNLTLTSSRITIANDAANPLSAPEILLGVDGANTSIIANNGASIVATGALSDTRNGDYLITGDSVDRDPSAVGAFIRVANGPARLVTRLNQQNVRELTGLRIGSAQFSGTSILLNTTGGTILNNTARLTTQDLALQLNRFSLGQAGNGLPGLILSPPLQAQLATINHVTLASPNAINFGAGSYSFHDLTISTPALATPDANDVTISAGRLQLANNSTTNIAACGDCGGGALTINAISIEVGAGSITTQGFGNGVSLSATNGITYRGIGGLDTGTSNLSLQTPYIVDQAAVATTVPSVKTAPTLTLATTGTVTVTRPSSTTAAAANIVGTPGARLNISGTSIAIDGSDLRATAGQLTLLADSDVILSGTATLETPSFARQFGDAADSVLVSAPGGTLSLTSRFGNITLGNQTALKLGGSTGRAGTLTLSAAHGNLTLGSTINAVAPEGQAGLTVDAANAFDLSNFVSRFGTAFTGDWDVHSGTGDLLLSSGQHIRANSLQLVADGGLVDIAGSVDTSGTNGGDISLYGINGVTLRSGGLLDAHANGYAASDTRQAKGGNIILGTDGSGALTVATGAVIDVAARRPGDRLVGETRQDPATQINRTVYNLVQRDQGGKVTLRAPVITDVNGRESVNITYSGQINGARDISIEGFRRYDLASVANSYSGVTINRRTQTAFLDVTGTAAGRANFLSDNAPGTIVNFVQNFDISASYAALNGLNASPVFHARPGFELDYSGNITLQSNWNLGAGTVDINGAVAAGLAQTSPFSTPGNPLYEILAGQNDAVFNRFTNLLYRVGGRVDGEAGTLTLRAGRTLDIRGSITDGFFQFNDQTNPDYLRFALGGGNRTPTPFINSFCPGFDCGSAPEFRYLPILTAPETDFTLIINFNNSNGVFALNNADDNGVLSLIQDSARRAPYSAAANSAGALGSGAPDAQGGTGDPLGSAILFPRLSNGKAVESTSYQLVGGADILNGHASVNPLRITPGAAGNVVVEGTRTYTYAINRGDPNPISATNFSNNLQIQFQTDPSRFSVNNTRSTFDAYLDDVVNANANQGPATYTVLDFRSAPAAVQTYLAQRAGVFFAGDTDPQNGLPLTTTDDASGVTTPNFQFFGPAGAPTSIATRADIALAFLQFVQNPALSPQTLGGLIASGSAGYNPPPTPRLPGFQSHTVITQTEVRTGDGSINLAAAGNIDLRNGATPTYRNLTTSAAGRSQFNFLQLGGSAVYTAGVRTDPTTLPTFTLSSTTTASLDATPYLDLNDYVETGALSDFTANSFGFLHANPVFASGGGDVTVAAGQDVLGRRNILLEGRTAIIDPNVSPGLNLYQGTSDQPYRVGGIGPNLNDNFADTRIAINPQLFQEGLGTLGGGNISVKAGGSVSDISLVATASLVTANTTITTAPASAGADVTTTTTQALITYGGGNIRVAAGGDINGGRLAIASGVGDVVTEGAVQSAGLFTSNGTAASATDNLLQVRVADAALTLVARDTITLQGIAALGVSRGANTNEVQSNLNALGFYTAISSVSLLTDASVTINNTGTQFTTNQAANGGVLTAVYPGTFEATALLGDINLQPSTTSARVTSLFPSPIGELALFAGNSIGRTTLYQDDRDPSVLPGQFSLLSTQNFGFVPELPATTDAQRRLAHNSTPTHAADPVPDRIYAGGDITSLTFQAAKQARVSAGRDLVDTIFIGQNLSTTDVTRITAGRDITATTQLVRPSDTGAAVSTLQGNSFYLGGPGAFFLEAGRDAGPFLNSAIVNGQSYGGGVQSVGNELNPYLGSQGAKLYVEFGVGPGADFTSLRNELVDPANVPNLDNALFVQTTDQFGNVIPDRTQPIYGPILIQYIQQNYAGELVRRFGTTTVTSAQAYQVFLDLPQLQQRQFLLDRVYFNELTQPGSSTAPLFVPYSNARAYRAVNTLFPAGLGYTANNTAGGTAGASNLVQTGNLDLRLASLETTRGGDITILGPGGRLLGGSVVRTSVQASRRGFDGVNNNLGQLTGVLQGVRRSSPIPNTNAISAIPLGFEGILTLRGGAIRSFTDNNLLLNQSRLFTEQGGDIALFSSNGDLNAGQGPLSAANFPPIVLRFNPNGFAEVDTASAVSGAGIAAFQPSLNIPAPSIFLIAPRGTVDAGDAGVRASGNLFVAAARVANVANFKVGGTAVGIPTSVSVDAGAANSAQSTSASQSAAVVAAANANRTRTPLSRITVDVLGFAGEGGSDPCVTEGPNSQNCLKKKGK